MLWNNHSNHQLYLLETLLISVDAVAIVLCDRTLRWLAAVLFRSECVNGLSLVKSLVVDRDDRVRIWTAINN